MIKLIALSVLLLFVSSCSLITLDFLSSDNTAPQNVNADIKPGRLPIEKVDYGPVTANDVEAYKTFQIRTACGETYDKLLYEFNVSTSRLVEIGKSIDDGVLRASVFEGMMMRCPDKIERVEPSIGKPE